MRETKDKSVGYNIEDGKGEVNDGNDINVQNGDITDVLVLKEELI